MPNPNNNHGYLDAGTEDRNGLQSQKHHPSSRWGPQQNHTQVAAPLPTGKNDLEVLESLKNMIKSGQHDRFQPVPQPAALASIFLGPNENSQLPPHPTQTSLNFSADSNVTFTGPEKPPLAVDTRHEGGITSDGARALSVRSLCL